MVEMLSGSLERPGGARPYSGLVAHDPLIIGHRGASGYRPEHTAAAYALAFAMGADAVEPDLVASKDGVLVVRHENEISSTTDVAARPEFAARRTTKVIDGQELCGWFTEDFTWLELSSLTARERLPHLRPDSAKFDAQFPLMRLSDLVALIDEQSLHFGRQFTMVAELKHATYFDSIGLSLDDLFATELATWANPERVIIESFEQTVLDRLRERGVAARYVMLIDAEGAPADHPESPYSEYVLDSGLARLADELDGISVPTALLESADAAAEQASESPSLVDRAHARGLSIYTWTLRPENQFLPERWRRGADPAQWGDWRGAFATVFATGVDGVFADHPDLAIEARQAG
jgi:glycerophosphoryl diester phosphodiesterase